MRSKLSAAEKEQFTKLIDEKIESGEFPEIIYKFRCWNDEPNDDILKKKTIYFSSPSKLMADYPEAILPIDESVITEENLMKIAAHHTSIYFPELPPELAKLKADQLRKLMLIEDPNHRKEAEQFAIRRNDETLGIFCSSVSFNNIAMWEKMACLGSGFAVGIKLRELLLDERVFGSAGIVHYYPLGNPPKVPPFSFSESDRVIKAMKEICNIPDIYRYEQEIRIVRSNRVIKNAIIQPYLDKDRIVELNDDHLEHIILGYNIDDSDKNEILDIVAKNFPRTAILKSKFQDGEIKTKQIN